MEQNFWGAFGATDIKQMTDQLAGFMFDQRLKRCLVVVVFANADDRYVKDNILDLIPYWHFRSSSYVAFAFLGYEPKPSFEGVPASNDCIDDQYWKGDFRTSNFVKSIESFEKNLDRKYSGQCSVIICRATSHHSQKDEQGMSQITSTIDTSSVIEFDLEKAQKEKLIEAPKTLFEEIIRFAKENSETPDQWLLSDRLGVKALGSAVFDSILQYLPSGVRKAFKAADYYRIRSLGKAT